MPFAEATSKQMIRSDPDKTQKRIPAALKNIYKVICFQKMAPLFASISRSAARAGAGGHSTKDKMSHIGKHYDLEIDGYPTRIVLVGQEYGQTQECVSLSKTI